MIDIFEYGNELFFLFLFPLVGLGLDMFCSKKTIRYLLMSSLVLLSPIMTSYDYVIKYAYQVLSVLFLGSLFSLFSGQIDKKVPKIMSASIISGLLFVILGFASFMDSFSGSQTVEKSWKIENYKIDYICDQGFAGRPLMKYELYEYGAIPIFIKEIETSLQDENIDSCNVYFDKHKLTFDLCAEELK